MDIKGQEFEWYTIFAPFLFLFIVFIIGVTLLNYKYVSKYDDLTKLEEVLPMVKRNEE
jgi:hypothetical protein